MNKTLRLLPLLALVAGLFATVTLRAADAPAGQLLDTSAVDAAWLAKAQADYSLKTCPVSDEELGGMGQPVERIYRQAGQPDRLVRFCCKSCIKKFAADPAKYLPALAEAAKAKDAAPTQPSHH